MAGIFNKCENHWFNADLELILVDHNVLSANDKGNVIHITVGKQ